MRNNRVSITKAVAIILMVLCHAHVGGMHEKVIALFHMPLFFFMSGYCFKSTYLTDFWTFLKRRFQGIYWPYVKWSLIFLLLHNIFCKLNIYNGEYGFNGMTFHPYSVSELSHDNSERARRACAKNLGRWMVAGYPYNKKSLKEAYSLLRGWHQPLIFPFLGRKFGLLRMLFGWRLAKGLLRLF